MTPQALTVESLEIAADPGQLAGVRSRIVASLEKKNLDDKVLRQWKLVINEIVTNAMIHGCRNIPEGHIMIKWYWDETWFRLSVRDPGTGPEKSIYESPSLPEDPLAEGGRGVFIIHSFADEVHHWFSTAGYRIEIAKNHPESQTILDLDPETARLTQELTETYENLAAFYRLGESMVKFTQLNDFIGTTTADLQSSGFVDQVMIVLNPEYYEKYAGSVLKYQGDRAILDKNGNESAYFQLQGTPELQWHTVEEFSKLLPFFQSISSLSRGCLIPVQFETAIFAFLVFGWEEGQEYLGSSKLNYLRTICDIFGMACAKTKLSLQHDAQQKILTEMAIATEIQKQLLPILEPPKSDQWELQLFHESFGEVAGDYTEGMIDRDGNLIFFIIDVMGKGVTAALLAMVFRSTFGMIARETLPLDQLMDRLNTEICRQLGNMTMFITAAIIRISADGRRLETVNAGHCPSLLIRGDKIHRQFEASATPLGLFEESQFIAETEFLQKDDHLLLFTDGLYEWKENGKLLGLKQFLDYVDQHFTSQGITSFWQTLLNKIEEKSEIKDDITAVVWRKS